MKNTKTLNIIGTLFFLFFFSNQTTGQRKIDTDSLLNVIIKDMKNNPPTYKQNIEKALLGKKAAPDYLDYHLLLGRNHELVKQTDSARYYYKYIIEKNPGYEDAFLYLINMEIEAGNYDEAEIIVNKAIEQFPDNRTLRFRKIAIYELKKDTENEAKYLKSIKAKYPEDNEIQQYLNILYSKTNFERIGAYYDITVIDREGIGPWHLASLEYMRQRKWGSLIGRINYSDRNNSSDPDTSTGLQYEVESYFFTGKTNYSYIDIAYSPDIVFPKIRLGYSYFHNFKKGWEADLGLRYTETADDKITTLNLGLGKYIGSYWLNLRTYFQENQPAFLLSSRYYYNTKFDYLTLMAGYGTSPDNMVTIGQLEQRVTLSSYRFSAGYSKLINNNYIFGILATYNNQEYTINQRQNEIDIAITIQYKF